MDITDDDLLRRAVRAARVMRGDRRYAHPRWVAVMALFALGSGYSQELCRRFGLDPDELVSRQPSSSGGET